ncbi:MAG: methyltransferase [Gemmatimonadaceae bacterium]|nr:methyltransferase [Gemmatimonadaceae bacterium]
MRSTPIADGYHTWRTRSVAVGPRTWSLATKPGLLGHGSDDPAARLLAERVRVPVGSVVVQMQCGSGLFGISAALGHGASEVWLTDRNAISVEAAIRSVELNGAATVQVRAGQGGAPLPAGLVADVVAIRIPTEKAALLELLRDAFFLLRPGGSCTLSGATNEGIKSAATLLEKVFGNCTVLATDSGNRVVSAVKRAAAPADPLVLAGDWLDRDRFRELTITLRGIPMSVASRPGVFSWEHLDEATSILADAMSVRPGDDVLDLGCGIGVLGLLAAHLSQTGRVTLVDADLEAVRCVRHTIAAQGVTRCEALGSDVAGAVLDRRFDLVVTNPPFHVGKATDLDVPAQFIRDAWAVLKPGGRLELVANRTLPYERLVLERFGNLRTVHDGPRFKVLAATR